ncbi:hypothetical protein [Nocardioides gilvus]|uniref:hypothetical protein n=1 Tax=Nocardioides gilvus TaxID=1735589 RepID=UPI000D7488D5|nr:hypothetical protein [Nocardioides gilvus]
MSTHRPFDLHESPARRGFSRRTVVRTAAWSVPAVTVAAAAPAFAASGARDTWYPLTGATATWNITSGKRWLEVGRQTSTSLSGIRIVTTRDSRVIAPNTLKVNVAFPHRFVRSDLGTTDRDLVVKDVSNGWVAGPPRYFLNGTDNRYAIVTFTYTEALQPGGGLFSGGTLPLRFDARRDTAAQHITYYAVDGLAFTYTAPGFSPPGNGVIAIV